VAEDAQLRARIELARALGDPAEERAAAQKLAEMLAARDVELDFAVELAFRSLTSSDDASLRHSLAGWLEGLGEPGLAASELRKLASASEGAAAAAVLVRIGVLHARAGDPVGAQEALSEAAEKDEAEALPLELLGAVAGWASATHGGSGADLDLDGFPGPRAGAEAYVRAARRRAATQDTDGEMENLLRAFELDPTSASAAAALANAYVVREREEAADNVLRMHAQALDAKQRPNDKRAARNAADAPTAGIHARRRENALEAGQVGRALGAALDEQLDAVFEGPSADAFDDLLARVGAYEALAVRLEVRAEREKGKAAAVRWAELGRLLVGPVAAPERALEFFARAVAADASSTESVHALRASARKSGDNVWLVEALVRAAMGAAAHGALEDNGARLAAAHELASLAEERNESLLAAWAYRVMSELDPSDDRARASAARLEGHVRRADEALASARSTLETCASDERKAALAEFVERARLLPDASRELARALLELAELCAVGASRDDSSMSVDRDSTLAEAFRVAERVGDFDGIARLAKAHLEARGPNVRVRGLLVSALRRNGNLAGASAAARVFSEESAMRWTCSVAWITAAAAGDASTRGRALAAIAPASGARVAATVAAVGAEILASVEETDAARRAAELACRSDGRNVRALLVLARVATVAEGRVAQVAIERAIDSAGASAFWCTRLSDILAHAGDKRGAVTWARRAVALRPGDPAATQALVDRAIDAGDAEALGEALAWLVPQPQSGKELSDRIAPGLEVLAALDASRAVTVARRALDVLGPRYGSLRSAIEQVADLAKDARLRAKVAERWIAAGAPAAERGPLLVELASAYRELRDVDAELHTYARAARAGVDLGSRGARLDELALEAKSPDAEVAYLEATAELRLDQGDIGAAASSFRDLGAALWDMADDRPRAVQAWLRAAHCDSVHGYDTLRRDLTAFADAQYAVDCLSELVDRESDRVRSGVVATQAARAALDVGAYSRALGLAKVALDRDPGRADALETAEQACRQMARVPEMSSIYDQVARRARGRFGRRAAHHRAARFFEAGGAAMMALKHAAQAFIAVPSEGTTLGLLLRTAAKAQRQGVAVRTVEHVAELARSTPARAGWLMRAASMTTNDLDGTRQRMDLLLKAAILVPSPATLDMLCSAAREVIVLAPEENAAVALRLERAGEQLAKGLEGPDGARIALTFSEMAAELFGDSEWAWRALEHAIGADADVDEYTKLLPHVAVFGQSPDAVAALGRVTAEVEKPYSNVGHSLLRLAGALAKVLGETERRAKFLVRAAEKESDDDALVVEADDAVSRHGDIALIERFFKKVGAFRRTEALRAVAKKAIEDGAATEAVTMLERANEIATFEQRPDVATELSAALVAAGRGEDAVLRELARTDMPKPERALRWAELGRIREERGEVEGAADAYLQAATDEPTMARWEAVERAADAAGREHVRVDALQHQVDLGRRDNIGEDALLAILKRLARAQGMRGALALAEIAWRDVLEIAPSDAEADVAVEALLVARGSFDDLALHLAERAARLVKSSAPEDKDKLRAVRLRRAAILEQRLSRLEEACAELEMVLVEHPGHPSALRWLADLYEQSGEPQKALPALERLFASTTEELEYVGLGVRRVRALLASGELRRAQEATRELLVQAPTAIVVAEVRVEVARAAQEPVELGNALVELARVSVDEPRVRSEFLVEAAQAAARAGDTDRSLARARDAARLAPDSASTQLFARGLEYRVRGVGTRDDALATIAALEPLQADGSNPGSLEVEDMALRAFLLAEAEDVARGSGAGEATLRDCLTKVGPQPLVALGLAERAAATGRHDVAYRFYTEAVYGNLLGLRRPGRVALAAAESAGASGDAASTQRFLNEAAKDPETRMDALRRVAQMALATNDTVKARSVLRGLAEGLDGAERAEILAELARALLKSNNPSERLEGDRTMREAADQAPPDTAAALRAELQAFRSRPSATMTAVATAPTPEAAPRKRSSLELAMDDDSTVKPRLSVELPGIPKIPPAPPPLLVTPQEDAPIMSVRHPPFGSERPPPAGAASPVSARQSGAMPAARSSEPPASTGRVSEVPTTPAGKVAKARARLVHGKREEAEKLLTEALREGSIEAADVLDQLLKDEPARRGALLKVRRQAVELNPGSLTRLAALRDAARADQNPNYVRAIEHVLRSVDPSVEALPAPPLTAQSAQPGILTLLTRHSLEPAGEAFGIVWEGAPAVFAKTPAAAGMTGLERVVPGSTSALSRLYEAALRLLDTPRVALFHKRSGGFGKPRGGSMRADDEGMPLSSSVALVSPAGAILTGDAREDTTELRWVVGEALSGVIPQNALVLGAPIEEARALWSVILGAFGPPGLVSVERKDAQLADLLWQTLPPRTQRRLKELLATSDPTPFELVLERAKQSGRRVGLFLTGDFGYAARRLLADFPQGDPKELERAGGLERLCAQLPSLADLLRLAVRPEYADARWHLPTPATQRLASGRVPPV
jgi:tetratricopeptide (TPR) repeat protein